MIFRMVLGHLVADYLLQNNWMAKNKKQQKLPLLVHCLIYTVVVGGFTPEFPIYLWPLIFLSHIILDGTHLIDKWFQLIRGRSIKAMKDDYISLISCSYANDDDVMRHSSIAITWFVQIVADNTIHIGLLYLISLAV